jgi:hypothetical protein
MNPISSRSTRRNALSSQDTLDLRLVGAASAIAALASVAIGILLLLAEEPALPSEWGSSSLPLWIVGGALGISGGAACLLGVWLLVGGDRAMNPVASWAEWTLRPMWEWLCVSNVALYGGYTDLSPEARAWWRVVAIVVVALAGVAVHLLAPALAAVALPPVLFTLVPIGVIPAALLLRIGAISERAARRAAKRRFGVLMPRAA